MRRHALVLTSDTSAAGTLGGVHNIAIASCIGELLSLLAMDEAEAVFIDEDPGEGASVVDLLRELERRWPEVRRVVIAKTERGQAIGLLAADGAVLVAPGEEPRLAYFDTDAMTTDTLPLSADNPGPRTGPMCGQRVTSRHE